MSDNAKICEVMFRKIGKHDYICCLCESRCDKVETLTSQNGYSNLMNHLKGKLHRDEWREVYALSTKTSNSDGDKTNGINFDSIKASSQAINIYRCINYIISNHLSMLLVEDPSFKELTNYDYPQSRKTMNKYILSLFEYLIQEITKLLPNKFGIILDGWSDDASNHMVAVFASFSHQFGCNLILLGLNVLNDMTNQSGQNHVNSLSKLLARYNKDLSCVTFLVAANTNLNTSIAKILNVPFVGCASHKLNLAVKKFLLDHEILISKVDKLMKSLESNNISSCLKETQLSLGHPLLRPVRRNATRWSSTYAMLSRYVKLENTLKHNKMSSIHHRILTVSEFKQIKTILQVLSNLESANKSLQEDGKTLDYCRTLFDVIIDKFGHLSPAFNHYLQMKPTNYFESGVVAVLRNQEMTLTQLQKIKLQRFLIDDEPTESRDSNINEGNDSEQDNILALVEERVKRQKTDYSRLAEKSHYVPLHHVIPTSNCCERLFSQARLEKQYNRLRLSHKMFEARMMLNANKLLWNALIVDKILVKEKNSSTSSVPNENSVVLDELTTDEDNDIEFDFGGRVNECPDVTDEDFELSLLANSWIE